MERVAVIIPARFQSTRFPGKPLVELLGEPMIIHTCRRASDAVGAANVYVATDSPEIADRCQQEGVQVLMTSDRCLTGTDRVHEASLALDVDLVVNVQGDEPLVDPADIVRVIDAAGAWPGEVINAMTPIRDEAEFRSPNVPHVVATPDGRLLYMSRGQIPTDKQLGFVSAMRQVCIYAFPSDALARFAGQPSKTPLEAVEDIEILRFLELGIPVRMVEVSGSSVAVDVPADVPRAEAALRSARG